MYNKLCKVSPRLKKVLAIGMCLVICAMTFVVSCSAADVTDITPEAAATQVYESIHTQLNFTTILGIVAVALGASLAIFLGWWAIRKVSRMVMNAFSKGRVSV